MGKLVPGDDLSVCGPNGEASLPGHFCHQGVHQRVVGVPVRGVDLAQHAASEGCLVGGDEYLQGKGGGGVLALLSHLDVYEC